jgi:hypothetical protein
MSGDAITETKGTNKLAISGFVVALVGIPLVGLVLGYVSLAQIRRSESAGRGFAIAALVISYGQIVFYLAVTALSLYISTPEGWAWWRTLLGPGWTNDD